MWAFFLAVALLVPATQPAQAQVDQPTLTWIQDVLDSWEVVSRRELRIPADSLPWIIFYDDAHAWHLNPETAWLPPADGPRQSVGYAGRTYPLIQVSHRAGTIWVPDREAIALEQAQPSAMPYGSDEKAFFITPLPARFRRLAGPDRARDLDELFLGLAVHELAHTLHLGHALRQIKQLRARYPLPETLDDNLVQSELGGNAEYTKLYDEERQHLMRAVMATDDGECRRAVAEALSVARRRKERFFTDDKAGYGELEDVFLAMEGAAMWVQYRTARLRAPQEEDWLRTLTVLAERHGAWSQEEGLGLFLLIDRLAPGWQHRFLSKDADLPSPFRVLEEAISRRPGGE